MEWLVLLSIVGGFIYLLVRINGYERAGQGTTTTEMMASRGAKLLSKAVLRRTIAAFPDRRNELAPDSFTAWSRELMNGAVNSFVTEDDLVGIYRRWDHFLPEFLRGDLPVDERKRFEAVMKDAFLEMMAELSA